MELTEKELNLILSTAKRQYEVMDIDSQKILLHLIGLSKDKISKIDKNDYWNEFSDLYKKELILHNNPNNYFIKVNEMISGKLKNELTKLIKNYE